MFEPIRPRPIIPSCMKASFLRVSGSGARARDGLAGGVGDALGGEAEVLGDDLHRRGHPERAHPEYRPIAPYIAVPSDRRSLFDRDPRGYVGRQDRIAVVMRLFVEQR